MKYIYHYARNQKSITENSVILFRLSLKQQINDKKRRPCIYHDKEKEVDLSAEHYKSNFTNFTVLKIYL